MARSTTPETGRASHRLTSLDIVRGVVMILMAIDHVRVYSGIPAGGPAPGVFFTRWVTHFCAPAFVFFAGTSAFLHGRKLGDASALARFLVVRGLLLVVLELTLIRFSWTFNLDYSQFVLAGVIWMIGWCMVLLAALLGSDLGSSAWRGSRLFSSSRSSRNRQGCCRRRCGRSGSSFTRLALMAGSG